MAGKKFKVIFYVRDLDNYFNRTPEDIKKIIKDKVKGLFITGLYYENLEVIDETV